MAKGHQVPAANHKEMIKWLEQNVQENYHKEGYAYDTQSGLFSKYAIWLSKDKQTWTFSLQQHIGFDDGKVFDETASVEIADSKAEMMFILRWS
jgi:hypothetical protein